MKLLLCKLSAQYRSVQSSPEWLAFANWHEILNNRVLENMIILDNNRQNDWNKFHSVLHKVLLIEVCKEKKKEMDNRV